MDLKKNQATASKMSFTKSFQSTADDTERPRRRRDRERKSNTQREREIEIEKTHHAVLNVAIMTAKLGIQ